MAKRIQGICIEIDGNTTKLNDALKSTNNVIYKTNSELKQLNQALKLDPKNTELLSQKQELLKKNISATTDKLNSLKQAQKQMGDYNKLTDEQKENYRALSTQISKTESSLKSMNKELKASANIDLSKLKDGLKKAGEVALDVAKKLTAATAAIGGALVALVAQGVKSYAQLEQNIGGVETMFGDSAQKVIENAKQAYKTAGVSANEYMAGVTSFSASLLQSLGGDTEKAADIADMAFRDMSDNANKFGTDMASIQNAYQGFAKQNYTMLDNLKLGYGGTKTEMERLLADAEKLTGVHYDISNLSDVYSAIHAIQEELGVTGTTQLEAEKTITGSFASMKAAFDNFLNGSGGVKELSETIKNFLTNVVGAVKKLAPDILNGLVDLIATLLPEVGQLLVDVVPDLANLLGEVIPKLFESLVPMLGQLINDVLPPLLDAVSGLIDKLLEMISGDTSEFEKTISILISSVIEFITENVPKLIKIILKIIVILAKTLADQIPTMITSIVEMLVQIIQAIIESLPDFIEAAIKIVLALIKGLIQAIPKLVEAIPKIITSLVKALLNPEMLIQLIKAAIQLVVALATGLVQAIPELIKAVPKIISELVKSLVNLITNTNWGKLGLDILKGILNGMLNFGSLVYNTITKLGNKIVKSIKSFFGIHSPSTLMEDEIGTNLTEGIVEGMENSIPKAIKEVNAAMTDLNNGIQASVNPTINPTANTNPLYLQIENFYNNRDTDIQTLAQELEFYRKNAALAKGGM